MMIEVMRTTNPVDINYIEMLLNEAGIFVAVLDTNMSIVEGSIGLLPRRVMISDEDRDEVWRLLKGSELESALLKDFMKN